MARSKQVKKMKKVVEILGDKTFCVLTGAGISTGSGIPDYRGMGSAPKKPLNLEPFIEDEEYRKDFWVEGYRDWCDFSVAEPNVAHDSVGLLASTGFVNGVITQNVDGLHGKAGTELVAELHGNMYATSCIACGRKYPTEHIVALLETGNPSLLSGVVDRKNFWVPQCESCLGVLKPDVVFFGEMLPEEPFVLAGEIARAAEAIVVAGTSLNVMSPLVFVQMVKSAGKPVIVINKGKTSVDSMADIKVDMDLGKAFNMLTDGLMSPVYI